MVVHTYDVITRAEQLSTIVESMLAAQRGYILSGGPDFMKEYEAKKSELSNLIADLAELSVDNVSQTSRINEIRHHTNVFTDRLEERSRQVDPAKPRHMVLNSSEDIAAINDARVNIRRINDAILNEEYGLLKERIALMENKKRQYFNSLLSGGLVGVILILLFNGFLFQAQSRRSRAEMSLQDSEQRFGLAIEGSNDGIWDWDIGTGKVFYSKQYFGMLGYYDREAFTGIQDDARMLIHPEDVEAATDYLNRYLRREISEYSNTFRMRHSNGGWVWINSRGKAIFSADGTPLRMVGAHTDITYMKESQERLRQEKDAAEQANRAKSDFLAHMSHEIRTPLTAISGIAEIMEKSEAAFDAKQQRLIRTLATSTSSLKDLISDILDFSKIESGELELTNRTFLLENLFEQVISIMMVKAHEKNLTFTFDYTSLKGVRFYGDSSRLRQILINLVGNALKFCDKGSVRVQAQRGYRDNVPVLEVKIVDTGIGIPENKFDVIFERFKQADSSVSRRYGGTGLGLPISKNLALMMGGDIEVESVLGEGSTFTLLVPFRPSISEEDSYSEAGKGITQQLNDQIKASLNEESRILLVEDYEGNVVVIGYILDDLNLEYDVARTGQEAIDLWKQKRYNAILMDVQMPEMDGLTACSNIRALEKENGLPHTPIIGMTAHALVADKDKCTAVGMDAYLPKPIVEADLKNQILKFVNKKNVTKFRAA
jgi:PAS domain S-box-containing protein